MPVKIYEYIWSRRTGRIILSSVKVLKNKKKLHNFQTEKKSSKFQNSFRKIIIKILFLKRVI